MATSTDSPPAAQAAVPTQHHWRSGAGRALSVALAVVLLAASLMKTWSQARYPQPPHQPWIENPSISEPAAIGEAALGLVLLAGFWPGPAWAASLATFSLFAIITAAEAIRGKESCGCFGAVQVRPIYTMSLDLTAVALWSSPVDHHRIPPAANNQQPATLTPKTVGRRSRVVGREDGPPPWQLPPSVLCGHLDQTRDWFATTPVALFVKDGIIISAKESAAAEMPDPSW